MSSATTKQDDTAVKGACGALGFLLAAVGIAQLCSSLSSKDGWSMLIGGLVLGSYIFTYKRSEDVIYRASKLRLLGVLAICAVPPLILLFCFGDQPGWGPWLVTFFLLSLSLGPVLLLRRFRQSPEKAPRESVT